MRRLVLQTGTEFRLFLRDPGSAFFALLFPLVLLVANNSIGGDPDPERVAAIVPMLVGMVLGMLGMVMVPSYIAEYRQTGVLRRLKATPTSPTSPLVAVAVAQLVVALAALGLLVTTAVALFEPRVPPRRYFSRACGCTGRGAGRGGAGDGAGGSVLASSAAGLLMGHVRAAAQGELSKRELEVLALIARGASSRETATELFITVATVKTHLQHIFAKLEVNDRTGAVAVTYERGLLGP